MTETQRLALSHAAFAIQRFNTQTKKDGRSPLYEINPETLRAVFDLDASQVGVQASQKELLNWYEINKADFQRYNQELADSAADSTSFSIDKEIFERSLSFFSWAGMFLDNFDE